MTQRVTQKDAVTTLLTNRWEQLGRKLADLAEALPEEQYETRPLGSVRTAGEVLRHVAFWNRYVADTLRGKKADDTANELSREEFATKAQVLDTLQSSAADVASALVGSAGGLRPEAVELVVSFLEHTSEHYGQLVVYARLHGIVPPASK
jgi:uncharacterized damage-inducible protein DinB